MAELSAGWAQEVEARLQALEAFVLGGMTPVERGRYRQQVEENLRVLREEK